MHEIYFTTDHWGGGREWLGYGWNRSAHKLMLPWLGTEYTKGHRICLGQCVCKIFHLIYWRKKFPGDSNMHSEPRNTALNS